MGGGGGRKEKMKETGGREEKERGGEREGEREREREGEKERKGIPPLLSTKKGKNANLLVKSDAASLSLKEYYADVDHPAYSATDILFTPSNLSCDDVFESFLNLIRSEDAKKASPFLSSFSLLPLSPLFSRGGLSLLHAACAEGKVLCVLSLIQMGFPVNCVALDHRLPIHFMIEKWSSVSLQFACDAEASETLSLLLTDVDPEYTIPTESPCVCAGDSLLRSAARFGCVPLFRILMSRGADPYRDTNGHGDVCTFALSSLPEELGCDLVKVIAIPWREREAEEKGTSLLRLGRGVEGVGCVCIWIECVYGCVYMRERERVGL